MQRLKQKISPNHRRQLGILYGTLKATLGFRLQTEDRELLENTILPFFTTRAKTVLFIGCEWYTKNYCQYFAKSDYWTLEADPAKKVYGSQQHIADYAQNMASHFQSDFFDLILCNGVLGWGLNTPEDVERACAGFATCLKPKGILMIGWNDHPQHRPNPPITEIKSLKLLSPYIFPLLNSSAHRCQRSLNHVFNFYQKP